jgi:predicted O-methyltransferase YrrM
MRILTRVVDLIAAPLTFLATLYLAALRRGSIRNLPVARALFRWLGIYPIRDHYYEPLFVPRHLLRPLGGERPLPGLDLNVEEQLEVLSGFDYARELAEFPLEATGRDEYHYGNIHFGPGDAEYLYSLIRSVRPRRMLEVGSGYSSLMAKAAIDKNRAEDGGYDCEFTSIEPFEAPWLERSGIRVVRERLEEASPELLDALEARDILFIDSSHVIRPQGDVLLLFLTLLPRLRPGVFVHVHDIFTPRDYPPEWLLREVRFWNEQYLLEAFLSHNGAFRVIGALNYLKHHHLDALAEKFPILAQEADREAGSFWIVRS